MNGRFRLLQDGELPTAAQLVVETFRTAYAGFLSEAELAALDETALIAQWTTDSESHVYGWFDDERLCGVCRLGPETHSAPAIGHIHSLYVHPEQQGHGWGQQMLTAAEDLLREQGFTHASLWVFEGNAKARRLYEHSGWTPSGDIETGGSWAQPRIKLTKQLDHS